MDGGRRCVSRRAAWAAQRDSASKNNKKKHRKPGLPRSTISSARFHSSEQSAEEESRGCAWHVTSALVNTRPRQR